MTLIVMVFLMTVTMVIHEAGHFQAMIKHRVRVRGAGVGVPIPLVPRLYLYWSRYPRVEFSIHPLLIGAFVQPRSKNWWKKLRYGQQMEILASGVWANLWFGFLMLTLSNIASGALSLASAMIMFLMVGIMILGRKLFCLLSPVIAAGIATLMIWLIAYRPELMEVTGPIGIFREMGQYSGSLAKALEYIGLISISLSIVNLLPFEPLDGGKITSMLLHRLSPRLQRIYSTGTSLAFALLIIWVFASDISKLFR